MQTMHSTVGPICHGQASVRPYFDPLHFGIVVLYL